MTDLFEYLIRFDILITLCKYRTSPSGHELHPLDDGDGDGDEVGRLLGQAVLLVGVLVMSELSTSAGFSCKNIYFNL